MEMIEAAANGKNHLLLFFFFFFLIAQSKNGLSLSLSLYLYLISPLFLFRRLIPFYSSFHFDSLSSSFAFSKT